MRAMRGVQLKDRKRPEDSVHWHGQVLREWGDHMLREGGDHVLTGVAMC